MSGSFLQLIIPEIFFPYQLCNEMQQIFSSLLQNEEQDHLSKTGGTGCNRILLPGNQEAATCSKEIRAIMGHLQNLSWMPAVRLLLSVRVFYVLTDCSLQYWVCEEKTVGLFHYLITLTLMKLYKHIIIKGVTQQTTKHCLRPMSRSPYSETVAKMVTIFITTEK